MAVVKDYGAVQKLMHRRQTEAVFAMKKNTKLKIRERKKKKREREIIHEANQNKRESTVQWVHLCATRDQPKVSHMSSPSLVFETCTHTI